MGVALSIIVGLVLLVLGGDLLVRGASSVARSMGVSPLLIGLTLVGFGTSTPELVTSVIAAMEGAPGIAIGNVVGSNTANILLILGLSAAIRPLHIAEGGRNRDRIVLALSALVGLTACITGHVGRVAGGMMVLSLIAYVVYVYRQEKRQTPDADAVVEGSASTEWPRGGVLSTVVALVGIGLTLLGADLLVDGSITLARQAQVPDEIVGLTLVAVGTSLPELVTSMVAAVKGHSELAYGNVVGSNIFNILLVLGASSLIHPMDVPARIAQVDIWIMLGATALLIAAVHNGQKTRISGIVFVVLYVLNIAFLASGL
jgi:cation:H+ antiporter